MSAPPSDRGDAPDVFPDLAIEGDALRDLIDRVAERLVAYIAALPSQPMQGIDDAASAASWVRAPLPERPGALGPALDLLFDRVIPCSLNTAAPGYLAYVPGGGLPSAAVAELLAALVNRYAGVWVAAPGAVELETQALRWLAELIGLPAGTLGVLTTGGSMSNLLAVVAARESVPEERWHRATIYMSRETHHAMAKAARTAGIPEARQRAIAVDAAFRVRVDLLDEAIERDRAAGLEPFFICASAGTVNTGAVDPLDELADLAARRGLWLHVDGAYGGIFGMLEECRPLLAGMARADSVAVDPHKGLFLPYGLGALLTRRLDALGGGFRGRAAYLPVLGQGSERLDFCELSPELSRDWRGLRLWLPLVLHGAAAFRAAIADKRALARRAWERLRARPDVAIAAPPELSLFAFRKRWPGVDRAEENRRNRALLERINAPRRIILTGTEIDGIFWLRICVLHLRTDRERIDAGLDDIEAALDAEPRG